MDSEQLSAHLISIEANLEVLLLLEKERKWKELRAEKHDPGIPYEHAALPIDKLLKDAQDAVRDRLRLNISNSDA